MVRETQLSTDDFIYPLFVAHGHGVRHPISSMPGVSQLSVDEAVTEAVRCSELGIKSVLLFGLPAHKDPVGLENFADDGIVQQAIRAIKDAVPELVVITDVCLCEYTDHGHCGVLNSGNGGRPEPHLPVDYVLNDQTLPILGRVALAHAEAGADIVAPSGMIGGMVGVVSRNGGMLGIVDRVTHWTSTPKRGQLAASGLGVAIFFDDYANTLIVGNTMRPITDRLRVSREKLAYLVDSTAAPIASLALVTTWIGMQVGLIGEAVAKIDGYDESAYSIFLHSLQYSFYPLLALFFVFAVAWSGRDFGPMLAAANHDPARLDAPLEAQNYRLARPVRRRCRRPRGPQPR